MHFHPVSFRRRAPLVRVVAVLLAAVLALAPVRAGAQVRGGPAADGPGQLIAFAACAYSIVIATPLTAFGAIMNCARTFIEALKPE